MAKIIVGIMGPGGNPTETDLNNAYAIGAFCALNGWTVLTGGSKAGVMDAGLKGAKDAGGDTIGILAFGDKSMASIHADHVIVTAMGSARNNINILTSDVVVACGVEAGTLSEIAMAIKAGKPTILLTQNQKANEFLKELSSDKIILANTADSANSYIKLIINKLTGIK